MLSRFDLKDYRLQKELSLRDVARYCNVCHELIGQVERGVVRVTKHNHDEIIKGINAASQAKAYGTFEADKEKEKIEEKGTERKTGSKKAWKTVKKWCWKEVLWVKQYTLKLEFYGLNIEF